MELKHFRAVLLGTALSLATAGLSGCGDTIPAGELNLANTAATFDGVRLHVLGEGQDIAGNNFQPVSLVDLLVPGGRNNQAFESMVHENTGSAAPTEDQLKSLAYMYFMRHSASFGGDPAAARNLVQDRLLVVSEQRCDVYLRYINRVTSQVGIYSGGTATVLGGIGALVSGGASQIFAGGAGLASGLGAQYKEVYLAGLTLPIITAGIREARRAAYNEMMSRREIGFDPAHPGAGVPSGIASYSVAAAIRDAQAFHAACSIVRGLEVVRDRIVPNPNVGLDTALGTIEQVLAANASFAGQPQNQALAAGTVASVEQARQGLKRQVDALVAEIDAWTKAVPPLPAAKADDWKKRLNAALAALDAKASAVRTGADGLDALVTQAAAADAKITAASTQLRLAAAAGNMDDTAKARGAYDAAVAEAQPIVAKVRDKQADFERERAAQQAVVATVLDEMEAAR